MKIAIVGAGIIGVTTAYELAVDGHEVTVFERHRAAAEEASFANAGVIAPGYVAPWAAPGMPTKVFKHLLSRHAPVKVKLPLNTSELRWMWQWYRASKLDTYLANRASMQSLATYSRERLHGLGAGLGLEYERSDGLTVLVPLLPTGLDEQQVIAAQRQLLDTWLAAHNGGELLLWYWTPMSLAFTDHLQGQVVIYDCMDELAMF